MHPTYHQAALLAIFMVFSLAPLWADSGPFGLPSGVYLGIGGVIVALLTFFGLKKMKGPLVDMTDMAKDALLTKEDVDRAVESVLTKVGVPALLADKIGDIVAMVLLGLPDWVRPVEAAMATPIPSVPESIVKAVQAEMVRQAADSHPAVLAEVLPGLPDAAYLVRDNRILSAERVAVDSRVVSVIRQKASAYLVNAARVASVAKEITRQEKA